MCSRSKRILNMVQLLPEENQLPGKANIQSRTALSEVDQSFTTNNYNIVVNSDNSVIEDCNSHYQKQLPLMNFAENSLEQANIPIGNFFINKDNLLEPDLDVENELFLSNNGLDFESSNILYFDPHLSSGIDNENYNMRETGFDNNFDNVRKNVFNTRCDDKSNETVTEENDDNELDADFDSNEDGSDSEPLSVKKKKLTAQKSETTIVQVATIKRNRNVPEKSNLGRIRKRNPDIWKRNIQKVLKNKGEEYVNVRGTIVKKRTLKPPCDEKCRLKCSGKIDKKQRELIFNKFWASGDYNKQSIFVGNHVQRIPKKRAVVKEVGDTSRRKSSLNYSLTVGPNQTNSVCKKMFLNTLGITDMWVTTALKKKDVSASGITTPDKRGTHTNRPNQVPQEIKTNIKKHIELFPPIESHYCRKRTKKLYLEEGLSVAKMYRLYENWTEENNIPKGTERQYRDIFNNDYNISFFIPKKDRCETCCEFNRNLEKTEKDDEQQAKHLKNKEVVRKLKEEDKESAKNNNTLSVACFDMQKVILIPCSETSSFYYKCKLSTFNFTVFDLNAKEGFCYIWHEQIAKRGANEIASCLLNFIKIMSERGKINFCLYSDNCIGQNKNRQIVAMYLYASKTFKVNIKHRFLEPGHTQNENDSVHALIEKNKKGKELYTPDQFVMLVKMCKVSGKPYYVKEMCQNDFFDFKVLLKTYRNFSKDTNNKKIVWNSIKEIYLNYSESNNLYIKYDLTEQECTKIELSASRENTRKKSSTNFEQGLMQAYKSFLPLNKKKYDHLMFLSKKVPEMYRGFYNTLTYEPNDIQEEESDSD